MPDIRHTKNSYHTKSKGDKVASPIKEIKEEIKKYQNTGLKELPADKLVEVAETTNDAS